MVAYETREAEHHPIRKDRLLGYAEHKAVVEVVIDS